MTTNTYHPIHTAGRWAWLASQTTWLLSTLTIAGTLTILLAPFNDPSTLTDDSLASGLRRCAGLLALNLALRWVTRHLEWWAYSWLPKSTVTVNLRNPDSVATAHTRAARYPRTGWATTITNIIGGILGASLLLALAGRAGHAYASAAGYAVPLIMVLSALPKRVRDLYWLGYHRGLDRAIGVDYPGRAFQRVSARVTDGTTLVIALPLFALFSATHAASTASVAVSITMGLLWGTVTTAYSHVHAPYDPLPDVNHYGAEVEPLGHAELTA